MQTSPPGFKGCPLPLYTTDHMFYNSRARDPAFAAAARRPRRSIKKERSQSALPGLAEKNKTANHQTIKSASSSQAMPPSACASAFGGG